MAKKSIYTSGSIWTDGKVLTRIATATSSRIHFQLRNATRMGTFGKDTHSMPRKDFVAKFQQYAAA